MTAHDMYCFKGTCYNPESTKPPRTDADLDKEGLCEYIEDQGQFVHEYHCTKKFHERKDAKLRFFLDPPAERYVIVGGGEH